MGIKGVYGEIGPGKRVALSKLATQKIESSDRPLRIAVDISIWQFQIQSGKGGSNPALRTLYYRLLRLLSLLIQPLFIFDGSDKPPFKRNARTNNRSSSLPNQLAKQMLELFGFPYLTAPGEAEAECALLQREGVVDAVLSEDVDTLMFGCTFSLRNWSSEGTRGSKCPTHVSTYHSESIKESKAGLDREGMILVALMSGGDYIPAGIPGFGIKVACEAARAGFGKDLCSLSEEDTVGLRQWRERLAYEIRTNESGHFRVKRKAFQILEAFPDKAVLGYYTHPAVSSAQKVQDLTKSIEWDGTVDVQGLRAFVAKTFEWQHLSGAKKYIRGLAPALLVQKLWKRSQSIEVETQDSVVRNEQEMCLIKAVCSRRTHFLTDGTPEIRVTYIPAHVVELNLEQEEQDDRVDVIGSDSETESLRPDDHDVTRSTSPTKKRAPSKYEPNQPEKIWIMETFAKLGVPLMIETWEEDMRNPKKFASRKARERDIAGMHNMKKGAIDSFLKTTKPGIRAARPKKPISITATRPVLGNSQTPRYMSSPNANNKTQGGATNRGRTTITIRHDSPSQTTEESKKTKGKEQNRPAAPNDSPKSSQINPWTLSRRPSDAFNVKIDDSDRYSGLEIYGSQNTMEDIPSSSPPDFGIGRHSTSTPTSRPIHKSARSHLTSPNLGEVGTDDNSPKASFGESNESAIAPFEQEKRRSSSEKERMPIKGSEGIKSTYQLSASRMIKTAELELDEEIRKKSPPRSFSPHRSCDLHQSRAPTAASPMSTYVLISSPLSPSPRKTTDVNGQKSISSYSPRQLSEPKRSRKLIALRESLEGSWKEMDDWEVRIKNPKMTYKGVEVVDLT